MPAHEPREITESFRIERVLKSSRSGIVFRAIEPATAEPVAIKLIPAPPAAGAAAARARFVALAELLTLLQPPGFPPLRDFGFTPDGGAFLVMDLIDGARVDRVAGLTGARAVALMLPVLDALATLAVKGLHHGNITPDNVLVGSDERVWLVGLGSAAFRPPGSLSRALLDDEASLFVAPECLGADGTPATEDWRSDLYSTALSLCALLHADVTPADAAAPAVVLPPAVAASVHDPNELRSVLALALRRSPQERPPSLDVVRDALRRALGAPIAVPGGDRRSRRDTTASGAGQVSPRVTAAPPSATAPPAAAAPAAVPTVKALTPSATPTAAAAAPAAADPRPGAGEVDWEEPEGAPAWLQESQFVPQQPEPRAPEPVSTAVRDEREDTNPVPLQRRTELPLPLNQEGAPPAATVGAPAPLPTPVIVPPSLPAPSVPPPAIADAGPPQVVPAMAAPPQRPIQFDPPAPAHAQPGPTRPPDPKPLVGAPEPAAAPVAQAPALRPDQRQAIVIPPTYRDSEVAAAVPPPPAVPAPPAVAREAQVPAATPPPPAPAAPLAPPPATPVTEPAAVPAPVAASAEETPPGSEATPASAAQPQASAPPAPQAAAPAKVRKSGPALRPLALVAVAAALVLVAAAGMVGMRMATARRTAAPVPTPVPTRPRATPVPQPTVSPAALESLRVAEEAAAAGDAVAAQAALAAISADDELLFEPADAGRLTAARATVSRLRRDSVFADLQQALGSGNLGKVRDTLRRLTREDEAALAGDPDAAQTLEEARRAINLLNLATKAQQAGNNAQALEHASALVALVPRSNQAAEVREKAASGLERDAETLTSRGQFELARERLDTVARHWSGRPGLAARVERVRTAEANDQKLASLLAQAEQAAAERRPDRGLELLRSVSPPAYYEQRFREARQRLETVLREIDANPPALEIPAALKLEYSKNKPFVLVVRITDDHAVKAATLFMRVKEAESYKEMAMRRTQESEWSAEITPALHDNKAVELYVVAVDHSGHTGQLGGPQQPLTLKKKWGIFGR